MQGLKLSLITFTAGLLKTYSSDDGTLFYVPVASW